MGSQSSASQGIYNNRKLNSVALFQFRPYGCIVSGESSLVIAQKSGDRKMHLLHSGRIRDCIPPISAIIAVSLFCFGSGAFAWQGVLVNAAAEGNIDRVKQVLASEKVGPDELANALGIAANRGHREAMKLLLNAGADPNRPCTQFEREVPLRMAISHTEAVMLLLDHGAFPVPDVWQQAIDYGYFDSAELVLDRWAAEGANDIAADLIRYAIKGDTDRVEQIVRSDAGKEISGKDRKMAFISSVNLGHSAIIKELIDSGSRPDEPMPGYYEESPVNLAARRGHADVVRGLLAAGIDLKKARTSGACPLTSACREGRIDIVKLLLDNGASAKDGSALAAAAGGSYLPGHGGGYLDVVKLLVERGADVNAQSDDCFDSTGDFKVTALQLAAREGHVELVRYLLEKGADPKIEMWISGATYDNAVTLAAWKGHTEIVKLFIEKGEDVNRPTSHGTTALMATASEGHLDTARFLVSRGADVNAADEEGNTPLFDAFPHAGMVKFLIEHGADPNARIGKGLTVLGIAKHRNLSEIVEILRAGRTKQVPPREAK